MKGQGTVLAMLAVVMLTAVSGIGSIRFIQQSPEMLKTNINDLSAIAEAETRTGMMVDEYLPLSGVYSVSAVSTGMTGDRVYSGPAIDSVEEDIVSRLERESAAYLENNYLDVSSRQCSTEFGDISVSVEKNSGGETVVKLSSSEPLVATTCNRRDVEARYVTGSKSVTRSAWGNDILELADRMERTMKAMESEASTITDTQGSGTEGTVCIYDNPSTAESVARSDAQEAIQEGFSSVEDPVLSAGRSVSGTSGARLDVDPRRTVKGSSITDVSSSSCGCQFPGSNQTCYQGSADYSWSYDSLGVSVYLSGDKKVPAEQGWREPSLHYTYRHRFN